jgi:zinc protease
MSFAPRYLALAACAFELCAVGCRKKSPTAASFRLDNGLRVELLATAQGDKAALTLLFDVGADHDPIGRSGMAHLVEHLFSTAGAAGKPARTIEQLVAQYGRDFHASTAPDYTVYGVEVPAGRIMDEIDDAASRMSHLAPKENDLARERKRLLGEIAALQEGDAISAAMTRAAECVRPTRGGGLRGGVAPEVEQITLAEVEAFRQAHYGGATARLIVAGHFDVEEATKRIKAAFAGPPGGKVPEPRPPAASKVTGTLVMGDAPSAVALAVPVPAPRDPIYPAFLALALRVTAPGNPARAWRADFAPLARPDVLFVTEAVPPGQQGEAVAGRMRTALNAIVTTPAALDEPARVLEAFGGALGMTPLSADACAAAPFDAAFAAGRRAQLGIDGQALAQAARAIAPEQLAAAAKQFDGNNSAAVITGRKAP